MNVPEKKRLPMEIPHQLCHALLRLLLRRHIYPKRSEVCPQLGIETRIVARITVNVCKHIEPIHPETRAYTHLLPPRA